MPSLGCRVGKLDARLRAPESRFGQRERDWEWRQTCYHLSASLQGERQRERDTWDKVRQKQHKGTQVHLRNGTWISVLKISLLFKTQSKALKDVGLLVGCLVRPSPIRLFSLWACAVHIPRLPAPGLSRQLAHQSHSRASIMSPVANQSIGLVWANQCYHLELK